MHSYHPELNDKILVPNTVRRAYIFHGMDNYYRSSPVHHLFSFGQHGRLRLKTNLTISADKPSK